MKHIKSGFTLVELLTVVMILALLVGILVPAVSSVRRSAKEAAQKAQFTTIDMALMAFKNDYGDYPPSYGWDYVSDAPLDYCGSQKLAEALLGWDLLGFHPKSAWRSDGYDGLTANGPLTYDPDRVRGEDTLHERKGPYLELATTNVFTLRQLFGDRTSPLNLDRFVICDVFGVKKITVVDPITRRTKCYNVGTPILYFKANTSSKTIMPSPPLRPFIYDLVDNSELIRLGRVLDNKPHEINLPPGLSPVSGDFVEYIMDPRASTQNTLWPYRPDSYILISAGADGFYGARDAEDHYGTADDITNF